MRRQRTPKQLDLDLRDAPRWGGRRPGAGRKPGPNPRVRHLSRPRFPGRFPAHVTLKVRRECADLRNARVIWEVERALSQACERGEFRLVHYSLQRDHAHLIVEATGRDALGRGMKSLGARIARAVNRALRRSGPVLADRYHLRVLETPRQVRNALAYVLLNARRHARRAVLALRIDPASSGRWFDGWRRTLAPASRAPAAAPRDPPPVASAHTWMLRVGWRRHGLIDPAESPGPRGERR